MERKDAKSASRRILTLIAVILLAAVVVCAFTACSLFTDAVKGMFTGESSILGSDEGDGDGSSQQQPADTSGEDQGGDSTEQGDDPADHTTVVTDPPIEVNSTVVQITSSLTYDKASNTDMDIVATHPDLLYDKIVGMGFVNDAVPGQNVSVLSGLTKGSSSVRLDGHYLKTLAAGNYYFYYCVYNDVNNKTYYEPFRMVITNGNVAPTDVKINYDVDCPNVYVTFRCDCGGAHTVSLDSTNYNAAAGASRVRITTAVDKAVSHTAVVTCATSGHNTSVTKASPDASAISKGYFDYKYSYMGHKADGFLEDDDEAADLLEYLAYDGTVISKTMYVSAAVHTAITADASTYLSKIQSMISIPWSLQFGISCSASSKEVTFQIQKTNAGATISSEYEDTSSYLDLPIVSHHSEQNVRNRGGELPIDNKKGVAVRNVKELLAAVEKGYRPLAADSTLTIYNKARDFCYTYLTDEMSAMEKLHVIYDYLAGEIDYDHAALNLFTMIGHWDQSTALATARAEIDLELSKDSNGFSDSMKAAILAARDSATDINDLIKKLKNDYLQRLGAFSIEGVFDDGVAVCEGISYAFMLLARIEGIECYQITGYATLGSWIAHAWNKVRLEGVWYCVDATWGNVYFNDKTEKYVTHRYFMVPESAFIEDHMETTRVLASGFYVPAAAVADLALGDAEYYKSVETSSTLHSTLYISNYLELQAAVSYYVAGGSNYIEVLINPTYKPTTQNFLDAYQAAKGPGLYSITYNDEGRVFIAYFKS